MAICCECGEEFDEDYAREEFNGHFNGLDYDEEYPDADVCADCAILECENLIQAGIDAMNGD